MRSRFLSSQGVVPSEVHDARVLGAVLAAAPVGLGYVDRECRFRHVNAALSNMDRRPIDDHFGHKPSELFAEAGERADALLEEVMSSGRPLLGVEFGSSDGRHFRVSYAPVADRDGTMKGAAMVVEDDTARWQAALEVERALDHASRLQQVAAGLSAALTIDDVAAIVVRGCMEVLGATCGVLALRRPAHLEVRHRFGLPEGPPSALSLDAKLPMPEAVRTRRPVLIATRAEWLARFPDRPPLGDFEAFTALPLLVEGRATGCVGIGIPRSHVPDERQLGLLNAIARQGAQAVERARLFEERAYVAAALQRGLLPARLPEPAGLDVAVTYRPVGDGSEVGGDFYDLVELGEGWLVAVGDVCGKGAPAAVLSGLVRSTIHAVAQRGDHPVTVLAAANRALRRHAGDATEYASAVCGVLTRHASGFRAVLSSAGHPPALVLRAGGALETLDARGVLLGVHDAFDAEEIAIDLGPGDALVLHTDGVTEARVAGELFGELRLHAVLAGAAGEPAATIAQRVDAAVREFQAGPLPDDAALLVLRVAP